MKLCKDCGKPGRFLKVIQTHITVSGEERIYISERPDCTECRNKKAKERRLENKLSMKEPKLEPKPKVIKPYKDLLGPSTQQMRNAKKIRPKTKCNDGWTHSNDNAPVAFGWCF